MSAEILKYLERHKTFSTFDAEFLKNIADHATVVEMGRDEFVVHEDSKEHHYFFLVLKGKLGLFKSDDATNDQYLLTQFDENEVFGETAALGAKAGDFSVKAMEPAKILQIPISILEKFSKSKELKKYYTEMIEKLSFLVSQKLDATYKDYFKALKSEKNRKVMQRESNLFLIGVCLIFGIGMTMDRVVTMFYVDVTSLLFNWVYLFVLLLPIIVLVKLFGYPLRNFGVTFHNFLPSLQIGLAITGGLWIAAIFGIHLSSTAIDLPFYQQVLLSIMKKAPPVYILSYMVHSYVQEFIARGVIQTTLQRFLEDEKGMKANFITSGLFALFHIHRGIEAVIITFVGSIAFGWVYLRDRNLVGVSLFHWSAGTISRVMGGI